MKRPAQAIAIILVACHPTEGSAPSHAPASRPPVASNESKVAASANSLEPSTPGSACGPDAWTKVTLAADWRDSSIDVDANGGVHVGYADRKGGVTLVEYQHKTADGSWQAPVIVDSFPGTIAGLSLRIDRNGGRHVAYSSTNSNVTYAFAPANGAWGKPVTVDPTDHSTDPVLAIDPNGGVHLTFGLDKPTKRNRSLTYAYKPSQGSWVTATLASGSEIEGSSSLSVDTNGGVHVAYALFEGALRYTYKAPGAPWTKPVQLTSLGLLSPSSLGVDDENRVHVSFTEWKTDTLQHAERSAHSPWPAANSVAQEVMPGSSLAIDRNGGEHVAYQRQDSGYSIMYLHKPRKGTWQTPETVDALLVEPGNAQNGLVAPNPDGAFTSLAIDANGGVHVTYSDSPRSRLKYAYRRNCPR